MFNKFIRRNLKDLDFSDKLRVKKTCLRSKKSSFNCEVCIGSCPEEAISKDVDSVFIDPILCIGCGNCLPSCPNNSIEEVHAPYRLATEFIISLKNHSWACSKFEDGGDIVFSCLRKLNPIFLEALVYFNPGLEILLTCGDCEECSFKPKEDWIKIDNLIGISKDLKFISYNMNSKSLEDRRGFLTRLGKSGSEMVYETIKDITLENLFAEEIYEDINQYVLYFLKEGYNKKKSFDGLKNISSYLIEEVKEISYDITHICPIGAMDIFRDKNKIEISWNPSACTYCDLCLRSGLGVRVKKENFDGFETNIIYSKSLKSCKLCKSKDIIINSEGYCQVCEKRRNIRKRRLVNG